jgi:membrane-bound metal-dependent hydrolase YbcI (DUF457 family)
MDIVTHAGIGLIAAAPIITTRPELALGIVAGSVLPDLDALGRIFGKKAFLRIHQTWSHALPVHAGFSVLAGLGAHVLGFDGLMFGTGLIVGLAFHILLDFTNTLGVTLFAPFIRKRLCLEWVFFIDAFVLLLTLINTGLSVSRFSRGGEVPWQLALVFFGVLTAYIAAKAILRVRAGLFVPNAVGLIPSALLPWRFFGVVNGDNAVRLFQMNAITGNRRGIAEQEVFDRFYAELLEDIPEFKLMRGLSPAYHIVCARQTEAGTLLLCRDLRTRNFKTTFGDLEVLLDSEKHVKCLKFHV